MVRRHAYTEICGGEGGDLVQDGLLNLRFVYDVAWFATAQIEPALAPHHYPLTTTSSMTVRSAPRPLPIPRIFLGRPRAAEGGMMTRTYVWQDTTAKVVCDSCLRPSADPPTYGSLHSASFFAAKTLAAGLSGEENV